MPFGLSNALPIFQALMSSVLKPFLHCCVLVFFDDIVIYSSSWTEHLQHLRVILITICAHRLHLKWSKCSFTTAAVHYLGHVITAKGVTMDTAKVVAMQS